LRDVFSLHVDEKIGNAAEQIGVVRTHAVATGVTIVPRFVVVPRGIAERTHDAVEIVGVLATHVLPNDVEAGRKASLVT
jgi:hypothetical protein